MLVIRLQRTGRRGHAMFRVVVQDSRQTPTSGKVVAWLGSYDPHAKVINIDKEKASFYLEHGAQPSERIAGLLKVEGVKLPDWVSVASNKQRAVKNADKRRSTRPDEPKAEEPAAPVAAEPAAEAEAEPAVKTDEPAADTPVEAETETAKEETTEEAPASKEEPEVAETAEPAAEAEAEPKDSSEA